MGNCAGIDWASEKHDVLIEDPAGDELLATTFAHDEDGVSALCAALVCFDVEVVAIERPDGLLVDRLLEAGVRVLALDPNQVKAARDRFRASGGKSDQFDRFVLCELARTDSHRFRILEPDLDETKALRALVRAREDLVGARVALANQLRSELERFWPGPIGLFSAIDSPISLAFLARYPSPPDARGLGEKRMAAFLKAQHYSSRMSPPPRTNFFPLYPVLVGALGRVGVPLVAAAAIISIGCLVVALFALVRLLELELAGGHPWAHPDTVRLTLLALSISPVAFVFSAAYAESLYLALSVGVFLCARRGQWALAGLLGGLGSATRGPGVLLVVPVGILYLYGPRADRAPDRFAAGLLPRYRVRADLAWLALAPAGLVAYIAYLALGGAGPFAFVRTQRLYWHHVLQVPWTTVYDGARAAWTDARGIVTGSSHATLFGTHLGASVATGWENLLPFVALVVAVPAVIAVWRRLPVAYGAFVTAAILLNLVTPVAGWPLQGMPRYLSVLFPLFIAAGAWLAEHRRARVPLLVLTRPRCRC